MNSTDATSAARTIRRAMDSQTLQALLQLLNEAA